MAQNRSRKSANQWEFKKYPYLSDYPKKVVLKNGKEIVIRPLVKEDEEKLWRFFQEIPDEDKSFLRDDVSKREVIRSWVKNLNYDNVLPLVALHNDRIIADATLHSSNHAWTRHIAEIRLVVAKQWRGLGLAKLLVKELLIIALRRGFEKIIAQIPFDQPYVIKIFESFGFEIEAILKKHILKLNGSVGDLVIMSGYADEIIRRFEEIFKEEYFEIHSTE